MTINKLGIRTVLLALSMSFAGFSGMTTAADNSDVRDLESFDRVALSGSFDVKIMVGESQNVVVYGDDDDLEDLVTKVKRGELQIYWEDGHRGWHHDVIEVIISVPSLTGFELSGSGSGEITNVDSGEFSLEISGSGKISVDGKCGDLEIEISGSGNIDSTEFICEAVSVEISGSGDVDVYASSSISAEISGSGEVDVWGAPTKVSLSSSGSGSINIRD